MREALIHSRNPVAVQLALRVGLDSMAAHRASRAASNRRSPRCRRARSAPRSCGRSTTSPRTPSWANLGSTVEPRLVTRIDDASGTHRCSSVPPSAPQSVIDPRIAFIVRDMMRDAAERGTGAPARRAVPASIPDRGQDGHDERQRRRVVHGDDARSRGRRVAGLRPTEDDRAGRGRRLARRTDLGRDDGEVLRGTSRAGAVGSASRHDHRGARPRDRPARRLHDARRTPLHRVLPARHRARAAAQHSVAVAGVRGAQP